MNRIYRLVWNAALNVWMAVAENAKGRGKGGSLRSSVDAGSVHEGNGDSGGDGAIGGFMLNTACRAAVGVLASLAFLAPQQARAADAANAAVVSGAGTVATSGATTTINQTTQKLAIDWTSLSTRANEALIFNQPNASAIALNRITGSNPSELLGSLTANGQVFILNPNGVLFGAGSQVNVGGLVASTLSLSNADFEAGNYKFSGAGTGSVVNRGTLNAGQGGYLALLAPEVRNEGVMTASLGTALLAAGNKVTLNLDNGSLLGYSIDQGAINALAENKHLIQANGGQVLLSAKAMDSLTTATVNNTGVIEAKTIQNKTGRIMLMGDMETGTVNVSGTLDASAPNGGDGGFIETSAAHVKVAAGTRVTTQAASGQTGQWLVDPQDYTVAASGGDITGADLSANLGTTNVTLQSSGGAAAGNGDININDAVSWSANTLTLTAARDVNINAVASATGSAGLVMNTATANGGNAAVAGGRVKVALGAGGFTGRVDMAGGTSLTINGEAYTIISSVGTEGVLSANDLQGIYSNGGGRFALGSDIDASATSGWNSGAGFVPLQGFNGRFNGLGHTINNILINRPTEVDVGLFGLVSNSAVRIENVGMVGGSVTGKTYTAALLARGSGFIGNSYTATAVSGEVYVGGLAGASSARIMDSYATGAVTGINNVSFQTVGGLVGIAGSSTMSSPSITNSYATGNVTASGASSDVGGLAGVAQIGTFTGNRATGNVSSTGLNSNVGGLAGRMTSGTVIDSSYATGAVSGSGSFNGALGGLVGYAEWGNINKSYATGPVTGSTVTSPSYLGGLVGRAGSSGGTTNITNSYATGAVTGPVYSGGLVGFAGNGAVNVNSSYATGNVTNNGSLGGAAGLVAAISATLPVNINNSYATGNVTGSGMGYAAGLVVFAETGTTISNSYATGAVTGSAPSKRGGLVAYFGGATMTNNFWNSSTATTAFGVGNTANNDGATPLTSAQFMNSASFINAGWDVSKTGGSSAVWRIYEGHSGPLLRGLLTAVTLADAADATLVYNAGVQTGGTTASTAPGLLGTAASGRNAGFYNGYYSTQQGGLDIIGGNLTVTPATLAVTGVTAGNKVYDTTIGASLTGTAAVTALGSDMVNIAGAGSGNFADKNVGAGKAVTVTGYTLSGTDAANYQIVQPAGLTADITQASLTITGVTAQNRVYNGDTAATLGGTAAVTAMSSDVVNVGGTGAGTFADKNVGTGKAVTVTGFTLTGADALNYTVAQPAGLTADVTQASLTVSSSNVNRVYDAGVTAAGSAVVTAGTLFGSDLLSGGSFAFTDKNAGTGKTVTVSGITVADGNGGANYNVTQANNTSSTITQVALSVTGVTAQNKVYDTGLSATLGGAAAVMALGSDVVNLSGTGAGAFANKNVGTGKNVTVTGYSLSGTDAANYAIVQPAGLTADITQASLAVTGMTAQNKVYDAGMSAALGGTAVVAALGSDVVAVSGTGAATFADKNVGTGKGVTVNGYTLSGTDAANYAIVQPGGLTANITQATLTVTGVTAQNKVYNGNNTANLGGTAAVAALSSDVVNVAGTGVATFADRNVGNSKTVTAGGYSLSGADAANYLVVQPVALAADITQASLTVSSSDVNRVYNAGTAAAGSAVVTGGTLYGSDVLSGGSFAFADKNVGTGKTVTVSGITVADGNGGANYNVTQVNNTSSTITQASLTITGVTAQNKVYDAGMAASLGGTAAVAALSSDVVSVAGAGAGAFADKNVGTGKGVTVTGYTLSGTDAANYAAVQPVGLAADITQATLAVTGVTAQNKVYNANTTATLGGAATVAALGSDVVTVAGAGTGAFADKNVGNGKTVTVSGYTLSGTDAGNYLIVQPIPLAADITPAGLTVTATGTGKVYDGTTGAMVAYGDNRLGSDVLGITGSASFADKNAGTGKAVNVSGISLSGADAGNYSLTGTTATTTASITPKALTVTAADDAKNYDGVAYSGGKGVSYSGFVAGDSSADVGGALAYSGSSQGAVAAGSYVITPGGLISMSGNYALGFGSGALSIAALDANSASLGGTALVGAYDGAKQAVAGVGGSGGGSGGSADAMAGALAAAAAEAGSTDEK